MRLALLSVELKLLLNCRKNAKEISNEIESLKERALNLVDNQKVLTIKIQESKTQGIDTTIAENHLTESIESYSRERYTEAEQSLILAINELDFNVAVTISADSSKILLTLNLYVSINSDKYNIV